MKFYFEFRRGSRVKGFDNLYRQSDNPHNKWHSKSREIKL